MYKLYRGMAAIIAFIIITIVIQTAFGDKAAQKMTVLIAFTMIIIQSENVVNFLTSVSNNLTSAANPPTATISEGENGRKSSGGSRKF